MEPAGLPADRLRSLIRRTLTDEDGEGRHLFKRWCEDAGMTVGTDTMGTMFATRAGTDPVLSRSSTAR